LELNRKDRQRKQANDVIAVLADWWPYAFSVFEGRRQPLKLGIHDEILIAANGAITAAELANALRHYCNNVGYLRANFAGSARVDLNGELAGKVTADEAKHAAAILAQRTGRKPKPVQLAPNLAGPKRIASAAARKAAAS
jgi:ProP effector